MAVTRATTGPNEMLKISKLTDYGTVVMAYLANNPERIHSATEVASNTHVNLPTVSKILKTLAANDLVASSRGAKGGYRVARHPAEISVADIIVAMEGEIALTNCAKADGGCEQEPNCSIASNWQRINKTVLEALTTLSLSDMTAGACGGAGESEPNGRVEVTLMARSNAG